MPIKSKSPKKIIETEMHKFKEGKLHSGKSDKIVTNPKQAIAISLSEARKSTKPASTKSASTKPASTKPALKKAALKKQVSKKLALKKPVSKKVSRRKKTATK